MNVTTFSFPTTVLFGAGALSELPQRLQRIGLRRPLVATDPGLIQTQAFKRLAQTLGEAHQGKEWFVYSAVHPNPIEKDVREAAAAFLEHGCDGIIGFGGGSPLDAGKACPAPDQTREFRTLADFMMNMIGQAWSRSLRSRPPARRWERSWAKLGHHARGHEQKSRFVPS